MAAVHFPNLYYSKPIIVILGSTGTGKSKLAIQIAKRFNGEIINADAMQLYKGLDIITNKVTPEEQEGIRHHLLGFLSPLKKLVVWEYKNLALQAIKDIVDRKKLPVVVGGTYYYVESLLYDFVLGVPGSVNESDKSFERETISSEGSEVPQKKIKLGEYEELLAELRKLDNEKLYERLKEVDPETAEKTHPNSRRKILRSIMVHHQFGETLSSLLNKQRSQPGGCASGGPLKFINSIILLLQCDSEILKDRLDKRVDDMMSRGLVNEVVEFYKGCNKEELLARKGEKEGVFQSIGLKEFYEFLILDEEKRETEEGKKALQEGENLLKIATRQYAKRQTKWILNRFLKNSQRQLPPIYGLNATDLTKWEDNVYKIAEEIISSHLAGTKLSVEPIAVKGTKEGIDKIYTCECGTILQGKSQYEDHLKSKKHQKLLNRKKKLKEKETESEDVTKTEINLN